MAPKGNIMEKFSRTLRGYNPEEVNRFLDKIINQVENMVNESKEKDLRIAQLEKLEVENEQLKEKIEQYERVEATLNKAIMMAQKTSEQIKLAAHDESELLIDEAKKNANRIVNEALLRAEKIESDASNTKRNVNILKRRLKNIIESQLEIIDDIDELDI